MTAKAAEAFCELSRKRVRHYGSSSSMVLSNWNRFLGTEREGRGGEELVFCIRLNIYLYIRFAGFSVLPFLIGTVRSMAALLTFKSSLSGSVSKHFWYRRMSPSQPPPQASFDLPRIYWEILCGGVFSKRPKRNGREGVDLRGLSQNLQIKTRYGTSQCSNESATHSL